MSSEVFKEIPGWPEYEISTDGAVRRIAKACGATVMKTLKWQILKNGYAKVALCRDAKKREYLVHRLVAMTFIGEPGSLDVCHCDGDKLNNSLANLRIDTRKGNMADQIKFGLTPRGERCGSNKYTAEQVLALRKRMDDGENVCALGRETGIPAPTLYNIKNRSNWGWL